MLVLLCACQVNVEVSLDVVVLDSHPATFILRQIQ
jgi:hypothetical protein